MLSCIKNMVVSLKDKGVSSTAKLAVGRYLKIYGEVQELRLDSQEKSICFTILLKGEHAALEILVRDYRLEKHDGQDVLIVGHIETSRHWLTVVAGACAQERPLPIPAELATALRVVA